MSEDDVPGCAVLLFCAALIALEVIGYVARELLGHFRKERIG